MPEKMTDRRIQWDLPLAVLMLALFVFAMFAGTMIYHRDMIFDDSFISYRYAKNLAQGYGPTWNPGEAPTEGYTNFLFVVLLAPFIRMGMNPLLVARIISLLATAGLALLCCLLSQMHGAARRSRSVLFALAFIAATRTDLLVMLGLETVLYAFFLFLAFLLSVVHLRSRSSAALSGVGICSLAAGLLRPEGILLPAVLAGVLLIAQPERKKTFMQLVRCWLFTLALPMAIYMGWKRLYYGSFLPNPFFIKASAGGFIRPEGFWSVLDFLSYHRALVVLMLMSLFVKPAVCLPRARIYAGSIVAVYLLFYLRVDTLMDACGRFLYPLAPILLFLALPAIDKLLDAIARARLPQAVTCALLCAAFILLFYFDPHGAVLSTRKAMLGKSAYPNPESLMQKEYRVAKKLSEYADIQNVRIACGDSGVIAYFTGAKFLDTVGLNDGFIARNRDIDLLTDYFFGEKPTLVFAMANKDHTWIDYGHGPLLKRTDWMRDPRWDDYIYAGTITTSGGMYDIHLMLRKDYEQMEELADFLAARIADRMYDPFPLPIGTYVP